MEAQPYYFLLSPSLLLFNSTSTFNVQNNSVDTVHANVWLLTCIVSCKYASYDVAFPCFCIQINFCDLDQGLNCSDECTWILDSIWGHGSCITADMNVFSLSSQAESQHEFSVLRKLGYASLTNTFIYTSTCTLGIVLFIPRYMYM